MSEPTGDYVLTIQIRFTQTDDPGARFQVSEIMKNLNYWITHQGTTKLQRVYKDKQPRKVQL